MTKAPTREEIIESIMGEYRDDIEFLKEINVRTYGLIKIITKTNESKVDKKQTNLDNLFKDL